MQETKGVQEWKEALFKIYNPSITELRDSEEAFTVFATNGRRNCNVLVGRYCITTGVGVVFDRR